MWQKILASKQATTYELSSQCKKKKNCKCSVAPIINTMTLGNRYNLSFRDIVTVCRNNLRLVCLWQLANSSNFIKFWQFYYLSETCIICYTECQVRVLRNTKLSYSLLPKNYYWKSCSSCQRKWSFCFCRWGNWLCYERTILLMNS